MNSLRYGLTRIVETRRLRAARRISFRFIDSFDAPTFDRESPTHNFVDDLRWLKGKHTVKVGANLRFSRIPSTRDSNSWQTATVNPSWVSGIGRLTRPGGEPAARPGAAGAGSRQRVRRRLRRLVAQHPRRALAGQPLGELRRDGNILPVGQAFSRDYASDEYDFYAQDSWRVGTSLTITAGLRYGLYSPPYEVNGLQVAPTISMGQWFDQRAAGMLHGVPDNQSPIVTFDLAGPKNGKPGYYEWDKNNFAPRFAVAWTPHAEGLLGALTGGDRMVVRGGYSKVFDRIGQGLALNFDSGRVRHVDEHQQPLRPAVHEETRRPGSSIRPRCRRHCRQRQPAGSRRPRPSARASSRRASTTRWSRPRRTWSTRSSRASWRAASPSRADTSGASGGTC